MFAWYFYNAGFVPCIFYYNCLSLPLSLGASFRGYGLFLLLSHPFYPWPFTLSF